MFPTLVRPLGSIGVSAVAVVMLAACGSGGSGAISKSTSTRSAGQWSAARYNTDLKGVCPAKVVLQTNWWPEPDHGLFYQLIGPNGTIDRKRDTYSGPLGATGVQAEIRAGGPAVGFQLMTSQLYSDDDILLGFVGSDEAITNSAKQPTTALLAWYARNPQIFFWGDPSKNYSSVADIGRDKTMILAYEGSAYLDVFLGKGLIRKGQLDTSYTGDPAGFVAADGKIVSQGFVTSEPYIYEHDVKAWKRPVKYLLLDKEYPVYNNAVSIRTDKLAANQACLRKLIPLLQKAAVDYARNPAPVNGAIHDFAQKLKGGAQISLAGSDEAVALAKHLGIIANGPDGVYGSVDDKRLQTLIDELKPILAAKGKPIKDGLKPSDLFDARFLDRSVKL